MYEEESSLVRDALLVVDWRLTQLGWVWRLPVGVIDESEFVFPDADTVEEPSHCEA